MVQGSRKWRDDTRQPWARRKRALRGGAWRPRSPSNGRRGCAWGTGAGGRRSSPPPPRALGPPGRPRKLRASCLGGGALPRGPAGAAMSAAGWGRRMRSLPERWGATGSHPGKVGRTWRLEMLGPREFLWQCLTPVDPASRTPGGPPRCWDPDPWERETALFWGTCAVTDVWSIRPEWLRFYFCSVFLFPPDSEFVEASPAPYSSEELGKSARLPFFSNSSRK